MKSEDFFVGKSSLFTFHFVKNQKSGEYVAFKRYVFFRSRAASPAKERQNKENICLLFIVLEHTTISEWEAKQSRRQGEQIKHESPPSQYQTK